MKAIRRNTAAAAGCAVVALIATTAAWAGAIPHQAQFHFREAPHPEGEFVFHAQEERPGPRAFFELDPESSFAFAPFAELWQEEAMAERMRAVERALAQAGEIRVSPSGIWRARAGSPVGRVLAHAEEIGLTEEQESQIRDMQRSSRRAQIRRDADLEIAEMDLEEMMDDESTSLDAIEQKMREVANLGVDAKMASLRMEREVMAILSPEQREQLDELMPERTLYRSILRERLR